MIGEGDEVAVHYVGKLDDGMIFDTTEGKDPFTFVVGGGLVLPKFEKNVLGMEVGESTSFLISADDAYGSVQEDLFIEIPIERVPHHIEPSVGMLLDVPFKGVKVPYPVKIIQVTDIAITIDANHPLAGKDLSFKVEVVSVLGASGKD